MRLSALATVLAADSLFGCAAAAPVAAPIEVPVRTTQATAPSPEQASLPTAAASSLPTTRSAPTSDEPRDRDYRNVVSAADEEGVAGGMPGGVVGGVPGGVVGGTVGGSVAPSSPGVVPFGAGMTRPVRLSAEPAALHASGLSGSVIVKCTLRANGTTDNCRLIKTVLGLDTAAFLKQLGATKWTPAQLAGSPVAVEYVITFKIP